MFANEDEGSQEMYDRLLAYSSTKQSIQMNESKMPRRKDDPMDVDALSKGKSKGKGKKVKGQNHTSNVVCWNCGKSGHYAKDCRQKWTQDMWSSRGKGKGKVQGYEHADGWTWSGEQAEGWWKATDGQSSGQWMSANGETAWEPEEPIGGIFEISGTENCDSKSPRRGTEQRVKRWQRPRREEGARDQEATYSSSATVEMNSETKKRQTVISPRPTERGIVVPPEDTTRHENFASKTSTLTSQTTTSRERKEKCKTRFDVGMRRLKPLGSKRHPNY